MLEEPVEELAMGRGPLLGQQVVRSAFSQENRKRFPRLTVRLVALEPSGSYTPAPEANSFTPTPEVNDEDLEDYDDWSDETPEPGVNSYPYTPAPDSNELWWFDRDYAGMGFEPVRVVSDRVRVVPERSERMSDPVLPILLPENLFEGEATPHFSSVQVRRQERRFAGIRFDPALVLLTSLLLLGILGGIGFGYLLTLIYQG
jgi:hypothetical protein